MVDLAKRLHVPDRYAIAWANGVLERLWHFTANYAPRGDIGRIPDEAIARACSWPEEESSVLIKAFIDARWADPSDDYRVVIHDWSDHCDDSVHSKVARLKQWFTDGKSPKLTGLRKYEKEELERFYLAATPVQPVATPVQPVATPVQPVATPVQPVANSQVVENKQSDMQPQCNPVATPVQPQCNPLAIAFASALATATTKPNTQHTRAEESTGIVANGNGNPPVCIRWPYLADPDFSPFVVAALEYWPDLIEEDLQNSWHFTWKKLDFEQRVDVVKRLRVRIEAGEPAHFVKRPPKYLENGDWKRPPRKAVNGNGNGNGRALPDGPTKSTYQPLPIYRPGEDS
jgi:hypothetical protein